MIKGILFDYGGTIDTNGLHWANVLWDAYERNGVEVMQEDFADAYKFGERALAVKPLVKPHHTFHDVLLLKITEQFNFLEEKGVQLDRALIREVAEGCHWFVQNMITEAQPVLRNLSAQYPLVIVSNFYGNLNSVLKEFGIAHYFQSVVESAVVGVRKPDPAIWRLGVEAQGLLPHECVAVGDSYSKDILPAKAAGAKAIWLNVAGFEEEAKTHASVADAEITDFAQVADTIKNLG